MLSRQVWSTFIIFALVRFSESKPIATGDLQLSVPATIGNANVSTTVGNSTLGFPRDFKLERIPYRSSTPFTAEAVFYNIVRVLEQIAPLDYRGLMNPQEFHIAEYPSPVISIKSPYQRGTIIRRDFAVESLWQAFEMMCQGSTFESSGFTMLSGSVEVGEITFEEMRVRPNTLEQRKIGEMDEKGNPSEVKSLENNTVMVDTSRSSPQATNLTDLSVGHFSLRFLHAGLAYWKTDIMMAIVGMLVRAAELSKTTRIIGQMTFEARRTARSQIIVDSINRQTAPYMNLQWVIEIGAEMARFMVHRSIWRELNTLVYVNDIQIGTALIVVPRPTVEGAGNGTAVS